MANERLYAWGVNTYGQLGDGTTVNRNSPTPIGACTWKVVAGGGYHSLGIRADDCLSAWGRNDQGQLGDGTTTNRLEPTLIGTCTWKAVAAGPYVLADHSLGLRADNSLLAWGRNDKGQLGDGSTTNRTSPTLIGTCTWRFIAAGRYHSLALRADYALYAWGFNEQSQLGDGTTTDRLEPVAIGSCTWKAIAAGQEHSLGLRTDNCLLAWGRNNLGQLGDGTTTTRREPTAIGTCTWRFIAAGGSHSLGIRADYRLLGWGYNVYGQVGDGTTVTPRTAPTLIGTCTWKAIAAGNNHSLAIRNDNRLFAWGRNSYGQLGDGTNTARLEPTQVGVGTDLWLSFDGGVQHSLGAAFNPITVNAPLPVDGTTTFEQTVSLSASYVHSLGDPGTLRFQADAAPTFDTVALVTETTDAISGERGSANLLLAAAGVWYWRVRGESGSDISNWLVPVLTIERIGCLADAVSPADDHDVTTTPQPFVVRAYTDGEQQAVVRLQLDTVPTFDSGNVIELLSDPAASGEEHVFHQSLTGSQGWYWRARAEEAAGEDPAVSLWSSPRLLNVNTGGAVPADIAPDPEGIVPLDRTFTITWAATLDHVLTPTSGPTLRLQVQRDDDGEFPSPETETSDYVSGGERAAVPFPVTAPGDHWFRYRTLATYGDNSDWVAYLASVSRLVVFVRNPAWQSQVGPRPNRVFVRIRDSATVKTAEVPDVPAAEKVDYWAEVPDDTSAAEAQATANTILAVLQARPVSVAGPIALNVGAGFDRRVGVQWHEIDPTTGQRVLREQHSLVLAKQVHNIDAGTTELHLGDYTPPPEETLARILAKLSRP